jgi:hypothetical protein
VAENKADAFSGSGLAEILKHLFVRSWHAYSAPYWAERLSLYQQAAGYRPLLSEEAS